MGMDVDVSAVHRRQPGMEPFEVMTSESQERMLAIVAPANRAEVEEVCRRWEVRASVVGAVTAPAEDGQGRLRILDGPGGQVLADLPAASLSDDAPLYDRPMAPPADLAARRGDDPRALAAPGDCTPDLLALLGDASWVYRQYDHQLFLNTVEGPGGDAAVLRLAAPGLPTSERAVALSTDSNPRWCALDPRAGTALTVAEAVLNVACTGARAVAVVNCLNFGNPEHPEVMWQLSESIDGMADACRALAVPVVGGNVSFYNESSGVDIDPTPVVGVLGLVERLTCRPPGVELVPGQTVILLGHTEPTLAGSRWAVERRGHRGGMLPTLDYARHRATVDLVAGLVAGTAVGSDAAVGSRTGPALVGGIHDVSGGGLGVAVAECAVRSGIGCHISGVEGHAGLFSESPSRVVLCTGDPETVLARAGDAGVPATVLGVAGGDRIVVSGLIDVSVAEAVRVWKGALPLALGEPVPG